MRIDLKNLVKLFIVAALLLYVFSTVQWRDTVTVTSAADEQVSTLQGTIVGHWDRSEVRFRADNAAAGEPPRPIRAGVQADGSRVNVTPGILTYVRNVELVWFVLAALCFTSTVIFAGSRWWWLLRVNALRVGFLEAQRYTWIGLFFNNLVPGSTGGDLVKAVYIVRRSAPSDRLAAGLSVVVDRVLGLASLALLGAFVALFFIERFAMLAVTIWVVIALGVLGGIVLFSRRVRTTLKLHVLANVLPVRVRHFLARLDQAVFFYRAHKRGVAMWLLAGILSHSISVLIVVCIGHGLKTGLPDPEYFVLVPIINIVSAIPIAPNGWGVGEALYANLFARYGALYLPGVADAEQVMRTRGVAVSLLFRVCTTIISLVGGLVLLGEKGPLPRPAREEVIAESGSPEPDRTPATATNVHWNPSEKS